MVIGGGADGFNNYTQRGSFHHIEETVRALIETFPVLSRLKMLRQWGGIVDMTGDRSPIIGPSPVPRHLPQLRLGHRRLQGDPRLGLGHRRDAGQGRARRPRRRPSGSSASREGRMIDESVAAAVAH